MVLQSPAKNIHIRDRRSCDLFLSAMLHFSDVGALQLRLHSLRTGRSHYLVTDFTVPVP